MFIPLHDDTPLRIIRFQWMTLLIIVLNVVVFLYAGAFSDDAARAAVEDGFGFIPNEMLSVFQGLVHQGPVPEYFTLLTHPFIHAGWFHLIGNMIFLWVFADNVEDSYGPIYFVMFYFVCAIAGALLHLVMMEHSNFPLIGASGAVAGVLASYFVLFPRARVWVLLFMRIPVPLPAYVVLGFWIVFQVFSLVMAKDSNQVAFWAHIGGFVMGMAITLLSRNYLFQLRHHR